MNEISATQVARLTIIREQINQMENELRGHDGFITPPLVIKSPNGATPTPSTKVVKPKRVVSTEVREKMKLAIQARWAAAKLAGKKTL